MMISTFSRSLFFNVWLMNHKYQNWTSTQSPLLPPREMFCAIHDFNVKELKPTSLELSHNNCYKLIWFRLDTIVLQRNFPAYALKHSLQFYAFFTCIVNYWYLDVLVSQKSRNLVLVRKVHSQTRHCSRPRKTSSYARNISLSHPAAAP